MTDPIRHDLISFLTKNEAEQFILVLTNTFGESAFVEVVIEPSEDLKRHVVVCCCHRLRLPKRVVAFAIGWASATTYYQEPQEALILADSTEPRSLYLYR